MYYLRKKGSGMLKRFRVKRKNIQHQTLEALAREKGLLLVGAAENTIRLLTTFKYFKRRDQRLAFDLL